MTLWKRQYIIEVLIVDTQDIYIVARSTQRTGNVNNYTEMIMNWNEIKAGPRLKTVFLLPSSHNRFSHTT